MVMIRTITRDNKDILADNHLCFSRVCQISFSMASRSREGISNSILARVWIVNDGLIMYMAWLGFFFRISI